MLLSNKVYTTVLKYYISRSSHILKAMKTKGKVEKPFEKLENFCFEGVFKTAWGEGQNTSKY